MRNKTIKPKLTKIRFFTTKIAVYYKQLTKILNGEWRECNEKIDTTNYLIHYQNYSLLEYINQNYFFNDNRDNIALESISLERSGFKRRIKRKLSYHNQNCSLL